MLYNVRVSAEKHLSKKKLMGGRRRVLSQAPSNWNRKRRRKRQECERGVRGHKEFLKNKR